MNASLGSLSAVRPARNNNYVTWRRSLQCYERICLFGFNKFEKLLERSIVRDRSIKFFPGPHWKRGKNFIGWVNTVNTTIGKAGLTPFLMEHLVPSGNQKKKTRFAGLFFLTGLRPVLPLGQCPPSKLYTL